MRRNLKRLLCLALAVVMTLGMLPTTAMANYVSSDQTLPISGGYSSAACDGVPNGTGQTFMRFTLVEFPNGIDATNAVKNANVVRTVDIFSSAEGGGHTGDNWAFEYKNLRPTNALDYYRAYKYGYDGETGMAGVKNYYQSTERVSSYDPDKTIAYSRYTSAQFRHMLGIKHGSGNKYSGEGAYLPADMLIFSRSGWGSDFPGFTGGSGGGKDKLATLFGRSDGVSAGYEPNKVMELLWYLFWAAPSFNNTNLDDPRSTNFDLVDGDVSVLVNGKYRTGTMGGLLRGEGNFPADSSFYRRTSEGKSVYRIIIETGYVATFDANGGAHSNWEQMTCRDWTVACSNDQWTDVKFPGIMYQALFSTMSTSAIFGYTGITNGNIDSIYYNASERPFTPANPSSELGTADSGGRYPVSAYTLANILFTGKADGSGNGNGKGGGMCVLTPDDFNIPFDEQMSATLNVKKTETGADKAYVYPMVAAVDMADLVSGYPDVKFGDNRSDNVKDAFEVLIREPGKADIKLDKSNFVVDANSDKQVNIYFGLKPGQTAEIKINAKVPAGTNAGEAINKIVYAVQEHPGTDLSGNKTWIGDVVTKATGSHPNGALAKLDDIYNNSMATSIKVTDAKEAFRVDNGSASNGLLNLAALYKGNVFKKTMELGEFYHAEQDEAGTYRNATTVGLMSESTTVEFVNKWHTPRTLELSWNVTKDASSIINAFLRSDPSATYANNWAWPFYFSFDATGMTKKIDGSKINVKGVTITNKNGKWVGDGYRGYHTAADAAKFDPARQELFGTFAIRSGDTATVKVSVEVNDTRLSVLKELPGLARFAVTETYPWTANAATEMAVRNGDYTKYMNEDGRHLRLYFFMYAREDSAYGTAATRSALKTYYDKYLESLTLPPTGTLEEAIKTTMYPTPMVYELEGGIVTSVTSADGFKWLDMPTLSHLSDVENTDKSGSGGPGNGDLSPVTGAKKVTDVEQPFESYKQIGYIEGTNGKTLLDTASGNYVTKNPPKVQFTNTSPTNVNGRTSFSVKKTNTGFIRVVDDGENSMGDMADDAWYLMYLIPDARAFVDAVLADPAVAGKNISLSGIYFDVSCDDPDVNTDRLYSGKYSFPDYHSEAFTNAGADGFRFGTFAVKAGDTLNVDVKWSFETGDMRADELVRDV